MAGDAADPYDPPARWCLYCYVPIVAVMGQWRHRPEQGPPVVACEPLNPSSRAAEPAPAGLRLRPRWEPGRQDS